MSQTTDTPTWTDRKEQETHRPTHSHGLADERTYIVVRTRWHAGGSGPEGLDVFETVDYGAALEHVRPEREMLVNASTADERDRLHGGSHGGWAVIDTRYADGCRNLA